MHRLKLVMSVIFILLSINLYANEIKVVNQKTNFMNNSLIQSEKYSNSKFIKEQINTCGYLTSTIAKRGCCSWHNGVCGCSGGRVVCCDGTNSPSCEC